MNSEKSGGGGSDAHGKFVCNYPLNVAAFTGGRQVPSGRFRVRQYVPFLRRMNIQVNEFCSRVGKYPPDARYLRLPWACALLADQSISVMRSRSYDVCLLQRELMSTICTLEPLTRKPRVLDVDDAIFVHRGGRTARRLATLADWVICGNSYLADWFQQFSKRISVIPTAVDTQRFLPVEGRQQSDRPLIIGWVGTSGHLADLMEIEPALSTVLEARANTRLRIVCDRPPNFSRIAAGKVDFIRWSEAKEVENIAGMDVGVMPLRNNALNRGKCSFKMLQYMGCGLPVVVSPIGMNAEVLARGMIGHAASKDSEWVDGIVTLLDDEQKRAEMGRNGRNVAVKHFDTAKVAERIADVLRGVAK